MPRKNSPLPDAKFLPPHLAVTLPRKRLFDLLDQQAGVPLVWVSGAPGTGKTTLLASYLADSKRPFVWYRCDAADSSLVAFFSQLARAASHSLGIRKRLPDYSREMWPKPALFAAEFFRAMHAAASAPVTLVFDNFEQMPMAEAEMIILEAVAQTPVGGRVFVTARPMPGAACLALTARQRLAIIDDAALAFDDEESRALAARVGVKPEFLVGAAQRLHGWAAGLILAYTFERMRVQHPLAGGAPAEGVARIAFFSRGLYDSLPAPTQAVLLSTFMLDEIDPATAATLSGHPDAGARLEELHQANLFVERLQGTAARYRYHPAFAEFLAGQSLQALGAPGNAAALKKAAEHALTSAQPARALDLFLAASAWQRAIETLHQLVEPSLAQGRSDQVYRWLKLLPHEAIGQEPWLLYQLGLIGTWNEDADAADALVAAAKMFADRGENIMSLKAAAALMDYAYHEWASFRDYDRWVARLAEVDVALLDSLPAGDAAAILHGVLCGALVSERPFPHAAAIIDRQDDWLRDESPAVRLLSFVPMLEYASNARDWQRASIIVASMDALLENPTLPVGLRARAEARRSYCFDYRRGDYERAAAMARHALQVALEHDLPFSAREASITQSLIALMRGDVEDAQRAINEEQALANPGLAAAQANVHYERAWWHALRNDLTAAQREQDRAAALFAMAGEAGVMALALPMQQSQLLAASGRLTEAVALLLQGPGQDSIMWRTQRAMLEAWQANLAGDDEKTRLALAEALGLARERELVGTFWALRSQLGQLLSRALAWNIESDWAAHMISVRRLEPPASRPLDWPWTLRVNLLGRVQLLRNGSADTGARPSRKPLELLCLALASPTGETDVQRIGSLLWPESDSVAMRRSLDTTLHRLKAWLGEPDLIAIRDGCLQIDRRRIWVDLDALQGLQESLAQDHGASLGALSPQTRATQLLALSRGRFAEDLDGRTPWVAAAVVRTRQAVEALIRDSGAALEAAQDWVLADQLYRLGLVHDPAHEPHYRGRLRCLIAREEFSQAQRVFRDCEFELQRVLGSPPSPETRALLAGMQAA